MPDPGVVPRGGRDWSATTPGTCRSDPDRGEVGPDPRSGQRQVRRAETIEADDLDALDAEIRSVFEPEELLVPDDVRGEHDSLEEAILTDGWPTLGADPGQGAVRPRQRARSSTPTSPGPPGAGGSGPVHQLADRIARGRLPEAQRPRRRRRGDPPGGGRRLRDPHPCRRRHRRGPHRRHHRPRCRPGERRPVGQHRLPGRRSPGSRPTTSPRSPTARRAAATRCGNRRTAPARRSRIRRRWRSRPTSGPVAGGRAACLRCGRPCADCPSRPGRRVGR